MVHVRKGLVEKGLALTLSHKSQTKGFVNVVEKTPTGGGKKVGGTGLEPATSSV